MIMTGANGGVRARYPNTFNDSEDEKSRNRMAATLPDNSNSWSYQQKGTVSEDKALAQGFALNFSSVRENFENGKRLEGSLDEKEGASGGGSSSSSARANSSKNSPNLNGIAPMEQDDLASINVDRKSATLSTTSATSTSATASTTGKKSPGRNKPVENAFFARKKTRPKQVEKTNSITTPAENKEHQSSSPKINNQTSSVIEHPSTNNNFVNSIEMMNNQKNDNPSTFGVGKKLSQEWSPRGEHTSWRGRMESEEFTTDQQPTDEAIRAAVVRPTTSNRTGYGPKRSGAGAVTPGAVTLLSREREAQGINNKAGKESASPEVQAVSETPGAKMTTTEKKRWADMNDDDDDWFVERSPAEKKVTESVPVQKVSSKENSTSRNKSTTSPDKNNKPPSPKQKISWADMNDDDEPYPQISESAPPKQWAQTPIEENNEETTEENKILFPSLADAATTAKISSRPPTKRQKVISGGGNKKTVYIGTTSYAQSQKATKGKGSGSEDFAGKGDNKGSKKGTNGKGKKGKSKGKDPTGEDQEAEPPSDEDQQPEPVKKILFEEKAAPTNWAAAFRETAGNNWIPNPEAKAFVPKSSLVVGKRAREASEIDLSSAGYMTPDSAGLLARAASSSSARIPIKANRSLNTAAVMSFNAKGREVTTEMDDDVSMNRADSSVLMGTSSVASSMFRNEVNLKPLLTESQIAKRQERIDNCKKRETYQRYLAAVPKDKRSYEDPRTPPAAETSNRVFKYDMEGFIKWLSENYGDQHSTNGQDGADQEAKK